MSGRCPRRSLCRPLLRFSVAVLIGACREDAQTPTEPETPPELAVSEASLSFRQIAAGSTHTCGVTTGYIAYCWGNNYYGQLGDGTRTTRLRPRKVSGGLKFLEVRPGGGVTCGLTTDSLAYCWGDNEDGAVGANSTEVRRLTPTLVSGGHHWRQVTAGSGYSCGIAAGGASYCWGDNTWGVLGVSSTDLYFSRVPVKVAGGLKFRRLLPAYSHTCGTTTDNRAYCWGNNAEAQLGTGTTSGSRTPVLVTGGLSWRIVAPGSGYIPLEEPDFAYTCGVTTDDKLYCWGVSAVTKFGSKPIAVATTRRFQYVKPGDLDTCALALSGAALCWGQNTDGQLGTGGSTTATPTLVAGGHTFDVLTAPPLGRHTCGVTTDHQAFCWGDNAAGQLGDGTLTDRLTPVAVVGPS